MQKGSKGGFDEESVRDLFAPLMERVKGNKDTWACVADFLNLLVNEALYRARQEADRDGIDGFVARCVRNLSLL
jgi:hypothetical protein